MMLEHFKTPDNSVNPNVRLVLIFTMTRVELFYNLSYRQLSFPEISYVILAVKISHRGDF